MEIKFMKKFTIVSWSLVTLFMATGTQAEPLSHYRKLLKSDEPTLKAEVKERLINLRQSLGVQSPKIELVDVKTGKPLAYGTEMVREKRTFSSSIFKESTSKAALRLRNEERLGKPAAFNPGKELQEALAEAESVRDALVLKSIGNMEVFISRVAKLVESENQRIADNSNAEQPLEAQVKLALDKWIGANDPGKDNSPISSKLGGLTRVEIYDGVVTRLIFERNEFPTDYVVPTHEDEIPAKRIELSQSMLITFRVGEDAFYLDVLRALLKTLDQEIDTYMYVKNADGTYVMTEKPLLSAPWSKFVPEQKRRELNNKETAALERRKFIRPYIAKRYEGARLANAFLKSLSPEQINFLIDMFLQLQVSLVPAPTESEDLINYAITEANKAFDIQESVNKKFDKTKSISKEDNLSLVAAQERRQKIDRDVATFKQADVELSALSSYLRMEKQMINAHRDRLKDLEEGKSWK